jgi:hypothetical protein
MSTLRAENDYAEPQILPINLIERPRVPKTAVPDLVDHPDGIHITLTLRSTPDGLDCPPPHTVLMLVREFEDLIPEELVRPSAFAA